MVPAFNSPKRLSLCSTPTSKLNPPPALVPAESMNRHPFPQFFETVCDDVDLAGAGGFGFVVCVSGCRWISKDRKLTAISQSNCDQIAVLDAKFVRNLTDFIIFNHGN